MLKRCLLVAAVLLGFGTSAQAQTFLTGRVDFNDPAVLAGANPMVKLAKQVGLASGGISYTNAWTSAPPPGGAAVGDKVTAIGFVTFSNVLQNANNFGVTANQVIAVYAVQGTIIDANPATLRAEFTSGAVNVYDRGNPPPALVLNDAKTWVPNINNLSQGLVGRAELAAKAAAYGQGPPGGLATDALLVIDPSKVNTAGVDLTNAAAALVSEFLFNNITVPGNNLFTDFDVVDPLNPQFFVRLNQQFQASNALAPVSIADLNTLFAGILGGIFATTNGTGSDFGPGPPFGTNPDTIGLNQGGFFDPGATFIPVQEIPEPATLLLLGAALGGIGLYSGIRRRYRRQRAVA